MDNIEIIKENIKRLENYESTNESDLSNRQAEIFSLKQLSVYRWSSVVNSGILNKFTANEVSKLTDIYLDMQNYNNEINQIINIGAVYFPVQRIEDGDVISDFDFEGARINKKFKFLASKLKIANNELHSKLEKNLQEIFALQN